MIISSKGRYAMKLMLDLAVYYQADPVKIKDIARRQELSDKYLEQIVASLGKAGLVKSLRGAKGGYSLNKAPSEYTVGSILTAVEGPISITDDNIDTSYEGATAILWNRLDDAISGVLNEVTLEDLLEWQYSQAGDFSI